MAWGSGARLGSRKHLGDSGGWAQMGVRVLDLPALQEKTALARGSEIPAAHWGGGWEAPPSQALSAPCFSILLTPMLT